jgi:N-acetylglucosamine-6-sulfatase
VRGRAAALAVLGVALCSAGCGAAAGSGQQAARPNIVVIMTDDQTLESMRVMPGVRATLTASGTSFSRAIVSTALCCPSRATLFSGQYSHNHGVLGNRPPEGGYGRLDTTEWLPVWLQRAGYHTVHIGKFLNRYGQDKPPTEVPPGWNEWYASVDPSTYRFSGYRLNENGVVRGYARYSTDEYAARAAAAAARLAPSPRPFFLSVAFLAPHSGGPREPDDPQGLATPHPADRHRDLFAAEPLPRGSAFDEADMSDKPRHIRTRPRLSAAREAAITENYRQELESLVAVDEGVVRIVQALRASGELDDTLIVFTSDNGFFHGEHRIPNGKVLVYEPSIRVPLVMRGPGVPRGARRRQLVTNADLAPTILAAAGATATKTQDGRSLFGLLRDRGREWGRELLVEGPSGFTAVAFAALRNQRFTYVEYENGARELYDLQRDPDQLESLHDDSAYARVQARLAERLAALQVCAGASCRTRPRVRVRLSGCSAQVRAGSMSKVRARRRGGTLRARVVMRDGRVVTIDRRLPAACRQRGAAR